MKVNKSLILFGITTAMMIVLLVSIRPLPGMNPCVGRSNSTYDTVTYWFGECHGSIRHYDSYETNRYCIGGILGIGEACTVHPEGKMVHHQYRVPYCYKARTGEEC